MSATSQFYEMVAAEYSRIERLKQAAKECGEIIANVTAAWMRGEIDTETKDDLIARACGAESEG